MLNKGEEIMMTKGWMAERKILVFSVMAGFISFLWPLECEEVSAAAAEPELPRVYNRYEVHSS